MATVVLDVYSKAYPFITNRIRGAVYLQSSPQAFVAEIIDVTAGHPERIWHFPGLPRNNYGFTLDEIDAGGVVLANLASFAVVPGTLDGLLVRNDEQIRVAYTPGLVEGATSFTFDGSETAVGSGINKPDYVGWEIVPSEIGGRGILVRGLDYSWDVLTGTLTLLQPNDTFQFAQYFNIHFETSQTQAGNSVAPTVRDFSIIFKDDNYSLAPLDFSKKLIVDPSGTYLEIQLPDITLVVEGRPLMVEVGGTGIRTVKFIPFGADIIKSPRGSLFAMSGESFSIYKYTRSVGVHEWRISEADGNFKTVGQSVGDDSVIVYNKQLLDGSSVSSLQYARIYNDIVLNLPIVQRVNYDDWSTGNNKYLFSLANSANPANAGKFIFPDRRDKYYRNNSVGKAGDYLPQEFKEHNHESGLLPGKGNNFRNGSGIPFPMDYENGRAQNRKFTADEWTLKVGGTETRPETILINQYVLL